MKKNIYLIVIILNSMFFICSIVLFSNTYMNHTNEVTQDKHSIDITYPYPVNKNGETYGVDIYNNPLGIEPDLIAAYGDNGVLGYIKVKDLDDNVTSPEEINMDKDNSPRKLLLYEKDGETVIGTLTLN